MSDISNYALYIMYVKYVSGKLLGKHTNNSAHSMARTIKLDFETSWKSKTYLQEQDVFYENDENVKVAYCPWTSHGAATLASKVVRATGFGTLIVRPSEILELNQLTLLVTSKSLVISKQTSIAARGGKRSK